MEQGSTSERSSSMPEPERLFTPRFALMFGFSFTVFLSAFQLLPTAPFHILSLGGSSTQAGLFLGFLTYASAISAPFIGARRRPPRQAPRSCSSPRWRSRSSQRSTQ